MYVRVPAELQGSILKEIRRLRLRSSMLYFPILMVIGCALAAGFALWKGHAVIELLRLILSNHVSDRVIWLLIGGTLVLTVVTALLYFLRQMYKDCTIETHHYCSACNAVDTNDTGCCPVCQRMLSEQAGFFYTSYSDETKILQRRGFSEYAAP